MFWVGWSDQGSSGLLGPSDETRRDAEIEHAASEDVSAEMGFGPCPTGTPRRLELSVKRGVEDPVETGTGVGQGVYEIHDIDV